MRQLVSKIFRAKTGVHSHGYDKMTVDGGGVSKTKTYQLNFQMHKTGLERVWRGFGASGVRIDGLWRFSVQAVRPALLTSLLTKD